MANVNPNPVLNQQNLQSNQPPAQGNNDAANLTGQIQANTIVTMKTEVIKLPDFYGDPSKDTITALEFMARIDECQITNEWNDITTFSYFRLALRGQADKWLSSVVRHLQLTPAQKTWTRIRPSFKTEFAAFLGDKLIIDGLAKLSHRPGENPRMFFSRLEEHIFVLKENYASYRVKPDRPAQEAVGGYSEDSLTKFSNDSVDNFANFMFTQMFKAAAPENVRRLLSHKDQTRLTVEDAYKVYFTDHQMDMDKKPTTIHAVNEESDNGQINKQDVAAFRPQQRPQNQGFQSNSNRGNNRSRGQNNRSNYNNGNRQNYQSYNQSNQPKSNASGNGKFCAYCKILNHIQEDCRKQIKDNKPCITNKGQLYWPKVNSTNDNPNTVQQNSNPNAIESVFH
jgi:hypothetical protein